jgi:tetratricopeptide (TPR) repeat protein
LQATRSSSLAFLRGNTQQSIQAMRKAVEAAIASNMPEESIAWTQFMLGEEYFQAGDLKNAEIAEQQALNTYPGYHHALAELAKIRSAQQRFEDSVDLYHKALAVIPLPAYAAALGDVYIKLDRTDEAKKQYELVEFIARLSALSKTIYNRELAMFYADHSIRLTESLQLAHKEFDVRHDIYTWDCLAWAEYRNGQFTEAASAMSRALALGTKDALLYFHAGMIYLALHDDSKARDCLRRALEINPHFHVLYADVTERSLRSIEARP